MLISNNKFSGKVKLMNLTKEMVEEKVKSLIREPKGKARIVCSIFSALLGLAGILMIIGALTSGSIIGLIVSILLTPVLALLPFYFYRFFKPMLHGIGSKARHSEEINNQVKEYYTLPFRKTYRGMAFYITAFILLITVLVGLLTQNVEMLYEISIIIPLMYLMRKGYRWVFILAIVWWALEKGLQLYTTPAGASIASILVWWVAVTYIYFEAFLVENGLVKSQKEDSEPKKHLIWDILIAFGMFVGIIIFLVLLTYAFQK